MNNNECEPAVCLHNVNAQRSLIFLFGMHNTVTSEEWVIVLMITILTVLSMSAECHDIASYTFELLSWYVFCAKKQPAWHLVDQPLTITQMPVFRFPPASKVSSIPSFDLSQSSLWNRNAPTLPKYNSAKQNCNANILYLRKIFNIHAGNVLSSEFSLQHIETSWCKSIVFSWNISLSIHFLQGLPWDRWVHTQVWQCPGSGCFIASCQI